MTFLFRVKTSEEPEINRYTDIMSASYLNRCRLYYAVIALVLHSFILKLTRNWDKITEKN